MQDTVDQLVVFGLSERRYALRLSAVERVVRAVEVTPLPKAPEIVLGLINLQGRVVPVVNVRRRFGLRDREIDPADQVIVAHTSRRTLALAVDAVLGVVERPKHKVIAAATILGGLEYVEGITALEDGLILIHDLTRFLSFEEGEALEGALGAA